MQDSEKLLGEMQKLKEALSAFMSEGKQPKQHEYLTISELAARLSISANGARCLARSQYLRNIKGAVLNVNQKGPKGKYEKLRVRLDAAIKIFQAYPGTYS